MLRPPGCRHNTLPTNSYNALFWLVAGDGRKKFGGGTRKSEGGPLLSDLCPLRSEFCPPAWVSLLQKPDDGAGATVDVEFCEDVFHVAMHGPDADAQGLGDFFVQVSFAQLGEDLMFAVGQL